MAKRSRKIIAENRTLVLGAGASRGVSYSHKQSVPSPLDSDFFILLQRMAPGASDKGAVNHVLERVRELQFDVRNSFEQAFYTLHLRALLSRALEKLPKDEEQLIVQEFARSVQALLREAHGKQYCAHHSELLKRLGENCRVISFNYDLVVERALKSISVSRPFDEKMYGLKSGVAFPNSGPLLLKLHGSSNWKIDEPYLFVRTKEWSDFDSAPGYRAASGSGTSFPIFLPFWEKRIERGPWLPLWRNALQLLRNTSSLVVWGYSLPLTDIRARHLFSLGLDSKIRRLCVIDPDKTTQRRWRELFPDAKYWPYSYISDFFASPPHWMQKP